jgi:hypothetical protein
LAEASILLTKYAFNRGQQEGGRDIPKTTAGETPSCAFLF